MRRHGKQGFTLIELLIVVVIIGILAAIVIPKFSAARDKAFKSAVMSDLKNLAGNEEVYFNENYTYASTLTNARAIPSSGVTIYINEGTGTGWAATAEHAGTPGQHCGVYHGNAAPAGGDPATVPGVVTCTF